MIREREGYVLITVLWVMAILTVMTLGLGHRAFLEARGAANSADLAQAAWLARAAVQKGMDGLHQRILVARLAGKVATADPANDWSNPSKYLGRHDLREEFKEMFTEGFQNDICEITVEDEEGRVCLNLPPEPVLLRLPGVSSRAVEQVALRVKPPEGLPLLPFYAAEELLDMEDVPESGWLGQGAAPGLGDLVTIHGDGMINLNGAPREVLLSIPGADEGFIDQIIAYRAGDDQTSGTNDDRYFRDVAGVATALGASAEMVAPLAQFCKTESQFFRITGIASRRQGRLVARCTVVCQFEEETVNIVEWKESPGGW